MSQKPTLKIDWASHEAAKFACVNWHYSKCLPIGKLVKVGVWEDGKYIGCIIYSRGTAKDLGTKYGLSQAECVELTRVALKSHKAPVSKMLALSLKFLKRSNPNIKLVVSFAARSENHHGGIYQATNWVYTGESAANCDAIFQGRRVPNRVIGEVKKRYKMTEKELIQKGILSDIRRLSKHRYLMPLDDKVKQRVAKLAKPYPKRTKEQALGDQPSLGGATPTCTLQTNV